MRLLPAIIGFLLVSAPLAAEEKTSDVLRIEDLDLACMDVGWGRPQWKKSNGGNTLTIGGRQFADGIGSHARSEYNIDLKKSGKRFHAWVGMDDEGRDKQGCTGIFQVWVDGKKLYDSGLMKAGDAAKEATVDLAGASELRLVVDPGPDWMVWDHADWADATISLAGDAAERPVAVKMGAEAPPPIAKPESPGKPELLFPRIVGATPGRPFVFLAAGLGTAPLTYSASGLPKGLSLDAKSGVISGAFAAAGETVATITAKNAAGEAKRTLKLVAGKGKLALTPPMGWNSWNAWEMNIDGDKIRAAGEALFRHGLAQRGFQQLNIDDGWADGREGDGTIRVQGKMGRVPDLSAWAHAKGLRLGIYTGPGAKTCGGLTGALGHEQQDAKTFAAWGIDYLKYDWCDYETIAPGNRTQPHLRKPYDLMRDSLAKTDRDIVFSLCQYGMGDVWTWGASAGGNLWRTTGDVFDSWGTLSMIAFGHSDRAQYAGPGHWNDADMLVVGRLTLGGGMHPTRLTANEQILHLGMWAMIASPLIIGCNLDDVDEFTLSLLENDEVIDIDQDPLGKAATRIYSDGYIDVWSRPLWDGTTAVIVCNIAPTLRPAALDLAKLKLAADAPVRDVWLKKDLGPAKGLGKLSVPGHGAALLKIGKPGKTPW